MLHSLQIPSSLCWSMPKLLTLLWSLLSVVQGTRATLLFWCCFAKQFNTSHGCLWHLGALVLQPEASDYLGQSLSIYLFCSFSHYFSVTVSLNSSHCLSLWSISVPAHVSVSISLYTCSSSSMSVSPCLYSYTHVHMHTQDGWMDGCVYYVCMIYPRHRPGRPWPSSIPYSSQASQRCCFS